MNGIQFIWLLDNKSCRIHKHGSLLPLLEKYANSTEEDRYTKIVIGFQQTQNESMDATYLSSHFKVFFFPSRNMLKSSLLSLIYIIHV